ncbi:MAG: hypothetical protein AB7W47_10475 [Calditrichaceae bacterium]
MKKQIMVIFTIAVFGFSVSALAQPKMPGSGSNFYLVVGSDGPGYTSPEEGIQVLEKGILPTFNALMTLEAEKKIIAGGLAVGDRALIFIVEASSNSEVDKIIRGIPAWGVLKWKVTALESFAGRAARERENLSALKKAVMK